MCGFDLEHDVFVSVCALDTCECVCVSASADASTSEWSCGALCTWCVQVLAPSFVQEGSPHVHLDEVVVRICVWVAAPLCNTCAPPHV